MATVSTYLNFKNETEEAFNFYKSVFGGDFMGEIARYSDMPPNEKSEPISDNVKNLVMHISLPILGGHLLMGSDIPDGMGFSLKPGNNVYVMLSPDTKDETTRLFNALSEGGEVEMEMADTFWGAWYGSCKDKFGVHWMFNFQYSAPEMGNQ
jgi:PhnB protein